MQIASHSTSKQVFFSLAVSIFNSQCCLHCGQTIGGLHPQRELAQPENEHTAASTTRRKPRIFLPWKKTFRRCFITVEPFFKPSKSVDGFKIRPTD
jgi:hypothetical protein